MGLLDSFLLKLSLLNQVEDVHWIVLGAPVPVVWLGSSCITVATVTDAYTQFTSRQMIPPVETTRTITEIAT